MQWHGERRSGDSTQTGETALTVQQLRIHGLCNDGAAAAVWPAVEAAAGEVRVSSAQRVVARATALQAVLTCDPYGCARHASAVVDRLAACIRCVRDVLSAVPLKPFLSIRFDRLASMYLPRSRPSPVVRILLLVSYAHRRCDAHLATPSEMHLCC